MKKITLMLLLMMAVLASCSSGSFKIEGNLPNLEGKAVRVLFKADSCIVDEPIEADNKGGFTFKGESSQPVLVSLLNYRGEVLTMLVAVNGDHIKVTGDPGKAMGIKISGSHLNEDWQLFRDEHAAFYADPNPSRLDAAIEKYVREHPTDVLSTVLLMCDYSDYSDRDKVDKMLNGIDMKARPESLVNHYTDRTVSRNANLPRLMSLKLAKDAGKFEEISLTDRVTLINLWANPQKDRNAMIQQLQALGDQIQVLDVLTESDTLRWHQTIASDPKSWKHYWAPSGPLELGIQLLGITSMPWYAVTDSTGMVAYSGPILKTAIHVAQEKSNIHD